MKIALAQTQPVPGNLEANLVHHVQVVVKAVARGAEAIIFSELSLTGYEPALASTLAVTLTEDRLLVLQNLSDAHQVTIAAGVPVKREAGVQIGMLIFQPQQQLKVYAKQYLHADEEPWFVPGLNLPPVVAGNCRVGLAVCYELSVAEHFEKLLQMKPDVYVASVAKFSKGIAPSYTRLAEIAKTGLPTLFVNAVGAADNGVCAGGSAVWNKQGELLAKLDDVHEGILIFDTNSETIIE
ncbi:MAG: carbon-nitrogen hydrolase family protein [Cytophagales bacterium]|nr:carbon-nitrogen hydrolase family protein [Cytophagales bacterium]